MKPKIKGFLNNYKTKLFFALLIIFLLRCGNNVQKGQFSVGESSAASLANDRGMVAIIKGSKLDDNGNMTGENMPILYFLAVLPEKKFTGLGAKNDNKTSESLFEYSWFDPADPNSGPKFVMKITLDREKDAVNIYDKSLKRQEGNAFLILFDNNMNPSVKQFKGLNSVNNQEVLAFFKTQDKDNKELQDLLIFTK